eukprot:m.480175 g.480175  ORF g.480175 m.480175 type:complete len:263 (+) comp21727_c0_seq1:319-1107(+)
MTSALLGAVARRALSACCRHQARRPLMLASTRRRGLAPSSKPPVHVEALGATPMTTEGAVELYDSWAATYDEALRSWEYPAPTRVAETLRSFLDGDGHQAELDVPILDLGCGTGMAGEALRVAGFVGPLAGVDVSTKSLEIAAAKPGLYAETAPAAIDVALPFDDGSFGAAVSVGVLSYCHHFETLFSEVVRVCRPGSTVVVTHRNELWDSNNRGVRTASDQLEDQGKWKLVHVGEPEDYMPQNPDPNEQSKRIRIIAWKTC